MLAKAFQLLKPYQLIYNKNYNLQPIHKNHSLNTSVFHIQQTYNQMQQQTPFSFHLKRYISMAMKIWPSLRVGMRHISDITGVQQHSLLPRHNYHTMTQQQFLTTLINDMHLFVMEHDVKEQDIEDYLNDILDLLSIDQDCSLGGNMMGSVRFMSRQVIKVITQLQEGRTLIVDKFQTNIYNPVIQMGVGEAIQQGGEDSDEEMDEEDGGYEDDSEEWDQGEEEDEMEEQQGEQVNENEDEDKKKQQQELEDDGWVIVKKKK